MSNTFCTRVRIRAAGPTRERPGVASLDLIVSFTLLLAAISVAAPLVVRHGNLVRSQRNYRLALDELSNQLDRLTAMPLAELPAAMEHLSPSPFIAARLGGVHLMGQLHPIDSGARITLSLTWDEVERSRAPVALSGWVFAPDDKSKSSEVAP